MATATRILASSQGSLAVLNYDDVTLLASGVTVANISGVETIVVSVGVLGVIATRTVLIGQTAFIPLASLVITLGIAPAGQDTFIVAGLTSYSIGSG